ncbi:MAG: hypothetical protein WC941_06540 [Candidatus Bathyarchaeia archaeon]
MNTHIFTEREHAILARWIGGAATREDSTHLHVTLNRLRANEKRLTYQVKFYTLALRRLHHGRLRHRPEDLQTTLALAPIPLKARSIAAYTLLTPRLRAAQQEANEPTLDAQHRLDAAREAITIAMEMTRTRDAPRDGATS